MTTYTATITGVQLCVRESRLVADLLIHKVTEADWKQAIIDRDVLQKGNLETARKTANVVRRRLEAFDHRLWGMVRDGGRAQATQATLATVVKQSRLLGDFMDIALRDQRRAFADKLTPQIWNDFLAGCKGRDPEMPDWSDATIRRLRSAVFCILSEAEYLKDTRSLLFQNVFVDRELADYLRERNDSYVLRCLEVME